MRNTIHRTIVVQRVSFLNIYLGYNNINMSYIIKKRPMIIRSRKKVTPIPKSVYFDILIRQNIT